MSAPAISEADMVAIQLGKWMVRGQVHNVTLRPNYSHPSVPAGEMVVAGIVDRAARGLFFSSSGFTLPGRGFVPYDDIVSASWISSRMDKLARKEEDFDHIKLLFRDGSSGTLSDVGQAVFPLLRFFEWLAQRRKLAG